MSVANRVVVATILALSAGSAIAQTGGDAPQPEAQYVIEQLVVSVSTEPDGAGERVDQIKSGERVEVLERQGEQSRVRLSSGQEGWVRSSYLSTTAPMREQLKARTAELEKLRAEKTKLETELAGARKAAAKVAATAAAAAPAAASTPAPGLSDPPPSGGPSVGTPTDTAPPPSPPMFEPEGALPSRPSWIAVIAVSLLTLIAGFVLGWRVLDKRIRAKYGGLRIY
jgi:SH3-like domain-containing protein